MIACPSVSYLFNVLMAGGWGAYRKALTTMGRGGGGGGAGIKMTRILVGKLGAICTYLKDCLQEPIKWSLHLH